MVRSVTGLWSEVQQEGRTCSWGAHVVREHGRVTTLARKCNTGKKEGHVNVRECRWVTVAQQ